MYNLDNQNQSAESVSEVTGKITEISAELENIQQTHIKQSAKNVSLIWGYLIFLGILFLVSISTLNGALSGTVSSCIKNMCNQYVYPSVGFFGYVFVWFAIFIGCGAGIIAGIRAIIKANKLGKSLDPHWNEEVLNASIDIEEGKGKVITNNIYITILIAITIIIVTSVLVWLALRNA